jgi:tetratricopeptide (TPR) repeat protein
MMRSERKTIALLLLLFLICLLYSNALDIAWHMDDFPNITQNPRLHLKKLGADDIAATFFASPVPGRSNQLYRPVACLTFALNWYFGQQEVHGYHIVNITLHFITAFLLYLTVLSVLKTPNLEKRFLGNQQLIALLTAALWAVNPVQTQAVDYIVQRMTILAALFYLLSIYLYIKARLSDWPAYRGMVFAACIISYLLAMGSKENAAILPFGLLLVEAVFFQDPGRPQSQKRIFWYAVAGGGFVFLTAVLFFLKGDLFFFLNGYATRPFSLGQRLLTEPRILIFYLSQLFFPVASRLSIQHDVVISTSLVAPWTTLPAMVLVFLLIVFGVLNIYKRPLAAFGVLFFFLNHLIESTVLPLELLFEHRNYLPSLFIFLPVAAGAKRLLDFLVEYHRGAFRLSVCCIVLVLMGLGLNTTARNRVWATQKSLWQDAMAKAPNSARPYQNLADSHMKTGDYDSALRLYHQALALYDPKPKQSLATSLNNSGIIYTKLEQYDRALRYYQKAQGVYPGHEKSLHNQVVALVQLGEWSQASQYADVLLAKYYYPPYLNLKGFILLKQDRPAAAVPYFIKALKMSPDSRHAAVNLAVAFSRTDRFESAERILLRLNNRFPADTTILLCQVENHLRAGDKLKADRVIDRLFAACPLKTLKTLLANDGNRDRQIPYSTALLTPAIAARLRATSSRMLEDDRLGEG